MNIDKLIKKKDLLEEYQGCIKLWEQKCGKYGGIEVIYEEKEK